MRPVLIAVLLCLSGATTAQDWALRDSDSRLSAQELARIGNGARFTYYDDGVSQFSADGSYSYTYADNGGTAFGVFHIRPDGQVCIDFRNGFGRCDLYVRSNGVVVMLSEKGHRFPVRVSLGLTE
ncbi:hypothetical protein ACFMPD_13475 [Sedimentitalea sp. HM32M-2]|uniref:hypothetical protein n=1 Tax=Sedimentitalea sp. HM32M-2 TaxID=3351566 RepID=UPI0036310657